MGSSLALNYVFIGPLLAQTGAQEMQIIVHQDLHLHLFGTDSLQEHSKSTKRGQGEH